jgi:uncharacterized protein
MPALTPFHLAFAVDDLEQSRRFYVDLLGCREGRRSARWIDLDLFGHQIVAHLSEQPRSTTQNPVDGHEVPVPHFGVILAWDDFELLAGRLRAAGVEFAIEPYLRFAGQPGEQMTMCFHDPSGNALEFKAFRDPAQIFAR